MSSMRSHMSRATPGQAMVEFALVATVFFLLVMGIVDFGRGIWYYNAISNAAREGARYAIINSPERTPAKIRETVIEKAVGVPGLGNDDIALDPDASRTPRQPITVTVTYDFMPITPLIRAAIGGGPITLTASSRMTVEY